MSPLPDAEASARWMLALAHGSDAALESIMTAWEAPLHRFIHRYVGEDTAARDLTQETFVRIYQNRTRYATGMPLAAWAFTIAANLCRNHRRWRWRQRSEPLGDANDDARACSASGGASGPDEQLVSAETRRAVQAAIEALPSDLRLTVLLFEFDALSYRDIAAITDCSERGIETRLARARERLRSSLGPLWEEILCETRVR